MVVSSAVLKTEAGPACVGKLDNTTFSPTINNMNSAASTAIFTAEQKCHQSTAGTILEVTKFQSVETLENCTATAGVEPAGLDDEPSVTSITAVTKGKVLTWVKAVVVQRVLKATCVLAVFLPRPHSDNGKDNGTAECDQDRICLLHGSQHMLFATRKVS